MTDLNTNSNAGLTDLTCIGELLIDFVDSNGDESYNANPGGAPANVAVSAQIHGLKTAFIGAVGEDHFGEMLINTLASKNVKTGGIQIVSEAFTTLAFVSLDDKANRSFSFARKPGADTLLKLDDFQIPLLKDTKILHFGSLSLSHEPARSATKQAVNIVKQAKGVISFDPNLRLGLWDSREHMLEQIQWGLNNCDLLKISEEDLSHIDSRPQNDIINELLNTTSIKLILLSTGSSGSTGFYRSKDQNRVITVHVPSDSSIIPVDTTGAGDIYTGSFLSKMLPVLSSELDSSSSFLSAFTNWCSNPKDLYGMLEFANQVAGLSTTAYGGIPSIPTPQSWAEHYRDS